MLDDGLTLTYASKSPLLTIRNRQHSVALLVSGSHRLRIFHLTQQPFLVRFSVGRSATSAIIETIKPIQL
jgi:hypothetical protein